MAELRGGRDESDDGDSSARRFPADASDGAREDRPRREPPLSRAEHADLLRQNATATNTDQAQAAKEKADQPDTDHPDTDPGEPDPADADDAKPGQPEAENEETDQPKADQSAPDSGAAETGVPDDGAPDNGAPDQGAQDQSDADQGEADQEEPDQSDADPAAERLGTDALERFDPRRAGLPEVSHAEAAAYIEEHLAERPWLGAVRDCSPDAQRVFVALDQGHGHGHIRHDGWVTEEMNEHRVRNLEDPAQLDPDKREAHVDAFKSDGQSHWCGSIATRIADPEAFAIAFVRGVEHPAVRAALDSDDLFSVPVTLPISDLLGEDGHKFCAGWQLEPVNGSMQKARVNRDAWADGDHTLPEPRVGPVETFEGGTITFTFRSNAVGGHEVNTMYVNPPDN